VKSPPFSEAARKEAGAFLRRVQQGRSLPFPLSRPMPSIGPNCHELRITDEDAERRIIYAIQPGDLRAGRVPEGDAKNSPAGSRQLP
jgi:Phage derived protein Gp49-like (DUF891)